MGHARSIRSGDSVGLVFPEQLAGAMLGSREKIVYAPEIKATSGSVGDSHDGSGRLDVEPWERPWSWRQLSKCQECILRDAYRPEFQVLALPSKAVWF